MSEPLPAAAAEIDWKLVASAVAVFIGTCVTTVWGWFQGRKKSQSTPPAPTTEHFQVTGAVLQDNQSLRDNTLATRELRDQIFLLAHIMEKHVKVQDDIHDDLEALLRRLDKAS